MYFIKSAGARVLVELLICFAVVLGVGAGVAAGEITSFEPADESQMSGTSQEISWTGTGNWAYLLKVGTTPGGTEILNADYIDIAGSSYEVTGLPTNGRPVYVTLSYLQGPTTWQSISFTYTAFNEFNNAVELSAVPPWAKNFPAAQRVVLVLGGEAVLDNETGLVWEQSPDPTQRDWDEARRHCVSNSAGNRRGWILPSINLLASLVHPLNTPPRLPTDHPFSNVKSSLYWSASTDAETPTKAWQLGFGFTGTDTLIKTIRIFVWCVRGNQSASTY